MSDPSHSPAIVLTTTAGDRDAELVARILVERGLAACVQIVPRVRSVYQWQGRIESTAECLLVIKSSNERYVEIERTILELHREQGWYETPEVIRLGVSGGSKDYLKWLFYSIDPKSRTTS